MTKESRYVHTEVWGDKIIKAPKQEPCEDAISRAYIEPIIEELENICVNCDEHILNLLADIKNAPPVTPQPKTGRWIKVTNGRGGHECDLCHEYAPSYQSGDEYLTKYCPNCGTKMESEAEELDNLDSMLEDLWNATVSDKNTGE